MVEGIEIHFDEEEGHLRLDCGEAEFDQIRDQIVAEGLGDGRLDPGVESIRTILVRRAAAIDTGTASWLRRWGGMALIAAVLALAVVLQVVGLVAAARWLLGGGP